MAYKDIYRNLTDEEKELMIKADIPEFKCIGIADLTDEELEEGKKALLRMIEHFNKNKEKSNGETNYF